MQYPIGQQWFDAESKYLTLELRDSTDLVGDPESLRERMREDGFLFLRGLHDREAVLKARRDILDRMAERGRLDPNAPRMEGVINPLLQESATSSVRGNASLHTESLKAVVYGERVLRFFEAFRGGPVVSYQFQWLRTAGFGAGSPIHCDAPYMGRGTPHLFTCWTPLGDIPPEMGPLVLCLGSHKWEKVIATYGRSDVDRDLTTGALTDNAAELVDLFGGRWATTSFRAGDVVIVSIYNIHASLSNQTNRYRISCDTRYQRAQEPMDDRWAGAEPIGHTRFWEPGVQLEPLAVSRRRWMESMRP